MSLHFCFFLFLVYVICLLKLGFWDGTSFFLCVLRSFGKHIFWRGNNWISKFHFTLKFLFWWSVICLLTFGLYDGTFLLDFVVCVALVHTWVCMIMIAYVNLISLCCFVLLESGICLPAFQLQGGAPLFDLVDFISFVWTWIGVMIIACLSLISFWRFKTFRICHTSTSICSLVQCFFVCFLVSVALAWAWLGAMINDYVTIITFFCFVLSKSVIFLQKFELWDGSTCAYFVYCVFLMRTWSLGLSTVM